VIPSSLVAACVAVPVVTALDPQLDTREDYETTSATCVYGDLDVGTRYAALFPDTGLSRGFELARLRGEVGARFGGLSVRASVLPARSGGADGYVGIAGEAVVPIWQVLEARYDVPRYGLAFAGGMVDHIGLMPIQGAWGQVAVARPMLTDQGFENRSDLGGWASWTAPDSWVTATVSLTSGEGSNRRERNDGVDTTATLRVRPIDGLTVMAWGREGSDGLLQARDHRVGGAAWYQHPWVVVGADGMRGWGLGGDGLQEPAGISAWARTGTRSPVVGWARVDRVTNQLGVEGAGGTVSRLVAGPKLPPATGGLGYLVVGWEGRSLGEAAAPVAGGAATSGTNTLFVQLGGRLHGGVWLRTDGGTTP